MQMQLWCSEKRRNAAGVIFSPLRTNVVLRVSLHVLCFSRTGPAVGTGLHGNLCPLSCQVWLSLLGTHAAWLRYRFRTFFSSYLDLSWFLPPHCAFFCCCVLPPLVIISFFFLHLIRVVFSRLRCVLEGCVTCSRVVRLFPMIAPRRNSGFAVSIHTSLGTRLVLCQWLMVLFPSFVRTLFQESCNYVHVL